MSQGELNPLFHDKSILVTGGTGSFGRRFIKTILERYNARRVIVFSRDELKQYEMAQHFPTTKYPAMRYFIGDVRDAQTLTALVRRVQPEVVFHMAAQALVRASYADPAGTYATNVMGTVNLLEAVRQVGGVRAVVVVTSDKCYENREWLWAYREGEPLGGVDPYSSSKACAELVAQSWRQSFFAPQRYAEHGTALASARAGNVIGGGDWATDRIVTDFVSAIRRGQPLTLRNPLATRPWQHVLEPLSGYLNLAAHLVRDDGQMFADGWNFGPAETSVVTVELLARALAAEWGAGTVRVEQDPTRPHEAGLLKLDGSKAAARRRSRWWHRSHRPGWHCVRTTNCSRLPAKP